MLITLNPKFVRKGLLPLLGTIVLFQSIAVGDFWISGSLPEVSPDAVQDRSSGLSYYNVDVSIDGSLFEDDGSAVEVFPGMVASLDVLAGKRTVLEYIWQPMAKIKERAFKD